MNRETKRKSSFESLDFRLERRENNNSDEEGESRREKRSKKQEDVSVKEVKNERKNERTKERKTLFKWSRLHVREKKKMRRCRNRQEKAAKDLEIFCTAVKRRKSGE